MRKWTVLVIAMLVMTACGSDGGGLGNNLLEESIENQLENQIKDETGENVDIDIDDDGEYVIKTDDSTITSGGDIPDGWPIPIPSGGEVRGNVAVVQDGVASGVVSVGFAASRYDELVAFYTEFFADYADQSNFSETGTFMIMSGEAGYTVSINLAGDEVELVTYVGAGG